MEKKSLIRTTYLYIFSLIGLILLTIGGVRLVDMSLRTFVFVLADEEQKMDYVYQPIYYPMEKISRTEDQSLTAEEKQQIKQMVIDYKNWQEKRSKIDPVVGRHQREFSISLALILIGLPLYFYHWRVIKKESEIRV